MVVEKGNKIFIPADQLRKTEIRVQWPQNLKAFLEAYYAVPFYNIDQGNEESVIFIQKTYLDDFRYKRDKEVPGDDLTIIVYDSFQYGQNREKTKRWLVFHHKENRAFQFRWLWGLVDKLGNDALKFGGGLFPSIDIEHLKALYYDFLHNF